MRFFFSLFAALFAVVTPLKAVPVIVVSPDSLKVTLYTGQSTTRIITIENAGTDTLTWSATPNAGIADPLIGLKVLVDKTHRAGSEQNAGGDFINILSSNGAIIGNHTNGQLTREALEGWDVFIMAYFNASLSPDEIDALEWFVHNGGGLLAREHYAGTTMGELMDSLGVGIDFYTDWSWNPAGVTSTFGTTPLTSGSIGSFNYDDAVRNVGPVTAPAQIVAWLSVGDIHSAIAEPGGRIFVFGSQFLGDANVAANDNAAFGINILRWLGAPTPGVSVAPESGEAIAMETDTVTVTFDATYLWPSVHTGNINIYNNDLIAHLQKVPYVLTVLGTPLTSVSTGSLDFPPRYVGGPAELSFVLSNGGNAELTATLSSDDVNFTPLPTSIVLPAGADTAVTVQFVPLSDGALAGTLTIDTNDFGGGQSLVALTGTGLVPAAMTVERDSIAIVVPPGDSVGVNVTLRNDGPGTQDFEAIAYDIQGAPGTRPFLFDNFESGEWNMWMDAGAGGQKSVVATGGASGSVFSFAETASPGGHQSGVYHEFPEIMPEFLEFWVKPYTTTDYSCYFTVRDSAGTEAIFFFAQGNGNFYCNANAGGNNSYAYAADTWYHVEFRDINFAAKTFDYVVNDAVVQAAVSFRNAGSVNEFSRFDLYHYDAGSGGEWDNVFIPYGPTVPWMTVDPATGTAGVGSAVPIHIGIDASALATGTYETVLGIHTNHPETPVFSVPICVIIDSTLTGVPRDDNAPIVFALDQNVPNPFNPSTTIRFALPEPTRVELVVFDVGGRRVRTLVSGNMPRGHASVEWSGRNDRGQPVASGVYFYRLVAGSRVETRKMILLK